MRFAPVLSLLRHGSLPWLLGVAVVGLTFADLLAVYRVLPGFCGALTLGTVVALTEASLRATGLAGVGVSWAIMLVGMMPPLVSAPVNHVLESSLPRRRMRAAALLLAAYGAIWLAAGLVLLPLAIAVMLVLHGAASAITLAVALVWSCSPLAQVARNRCHRLVRIGLRGWTADRDCLRQGWTVAPWCILSCWPWMLTAMVAGRWHLAAMSAVTLFLLMDRILPPAQVRWRAPPATDVARLAFSA